MSYYDGTKLLSMLDINNKKPEIFICTSNRTAGKTTYFNRLLLNRWFKKKEKFILLYRFKNEMDNVADKFFKDINKLFFKDYFMFSKKMGKGAYQSLFIQKVNENGETSEPENCGYAIAINGAEAVKKNSHLLSDASSILFDEFQSETGVYCADEILKFESIHMSLARGNGSQVKYLPVYMLSNCITLLNPYYVVLDISNRLREDTKFLKGDGFVLEQSFNETASAAQKQSAFNRAFAKSEYVSYASQNIYLKDNNAFIEAPKGHSRYICTLKYKGKNYAIREFADLGIMYCDNKADLSFPGKIAITTNDHDINYVMLKRNEFFFTNMRYFFDNGAFRFKDLECKNVILKALVRI